MSLQTSVATSDRDRHIRWSLLYWSTHPILFATSCSLLLGLKSVSLIQFIVIDPHNITDFDRRDEELEEFALFAPAVAGKTAAQITFALDRFLGAGGSDQPFKQVQSYEQAGTLTDRIRAAGLGKWRILTSCYRSLASGDLDLRSCSLAELESIDGIGPKTSRFFVMHTRPDIRVAVLDTHVLAYLRSLGHQVPKATPQSSSSYARIERLFLDHAESIGREDLAAFDLEIWSSSTSRSRVSE